MLHEVLHLASIQYPAVPMAEEHLSDHTYVMQAPAWSSPDHKAVSLIRAWSCHNQPVVAYSCPNSLVESDQVYASPTSI
jgi:hypothetical protein